MWRWWYGGLFNSTPLITLILQAARIALLHEQNASIDYMCTRWVILVKSYLALACTQISGVRSGSSTDNLDMHGTSRFDIPSISTLVCRASEIYINYLDRLLRLYLAVVSKTLHSSSMVFNRVFSKNWKLLDNIIKWTFPMIHGEVSLSSHKCLPRYVGRPLYDHCDHRKTFPWITGKIHSPCDFV